MLQLNSRAVRHVERTQQVPGGVCGTAWRGTRVLDMCSRRGLAASSAENVKSTTGVRSELGVALGPTYPYRGDLTCPWSLPYE